MKFRYVSGILRDYGTLPPRRSPDMYRTAHRVPRRVGILFENPRRGSETEFDKTKKYDMIKGEKNPAERAS